MNAEPLSSSVRAARTRRDMAGFTLVEMLVVVIILGILAAVVGMNSGGRDEHLLEVMELQVRDAAERARALARSSRAPFGVVFDVPGDRFGIVDENGALVQDPLSKGDWVVDARGLSMGGSVDITAANFGVAGRAAIFDAQGVPLAGGSVSLRAGNGTRVLTLDSATGQFSTP